MHPTGGGHSHPPATSHFARQEALRLGCCGWGWEGSTGQNQGSHVCCPIRSDEMKPVTFPWGRLLGFSGVSWLSGAESQHSGSKEAREGMRGDKSNGPEVRSPSPQAILTPYWLGVPEGLLPEHPRDKGCLSWTLILP